MAGCGNSETPSLDEGRGAWLELEGADKTDLARTCRTRAAAEISESGGGSAQIRQGIETVDLDALIERIDEWYAEDRAQPGAISDVCFAEAQDLAVTEGAAEIEQLEQELEAR